MTKELLFLIDQMCRDKGISRDVLVSALESALLVAARKRYGEERNIDLIVNPETLKINIFETKTVVKEVEDPDNEIDTKAAKKLEPGAKAGDEVNIPLDLHDFGRIAAQTAKQVILQRVREAERDVIYNEFKDRAGQIVSGTVTRREKGVYYIDIGKTEAVLPQRKTLSNENLKRGDTVRAYIEEITLSPKGPMILISRTSPEFVAELFKMEVPEIAEGLVVIKDVVREPGERTKLAVYSTAPSIDPVGACVGMKGTRVQSIVRELRGERIDIIPWTDDLRVLLARALSPATVDKIGINEEDKTAMVVVNDDQLSIAIGKKGQNVKLAMKLTGWDIDILSDTQYSQMKKEPEEGEDTPVSPEGEAAPAEGEAAPAEGEAAPAEGEAAPAEGEAAPAEDEDTPVSPEDEAAPAEGEAAPAEEEDTPVSPDKSPSPNG